MDKLDPDYSIIIPVYYNEGSLKILFEKLQTEVLQKTDRNGEIIFIDDGSGDRSFDELSNLHRDYPGLVKIIKLTRNFGQGAAILSGFQLAKGECIITISADMQDPPSLILDMLDSFFNENYEIVICHRQSRDETWFRRKTSAFFYGLIKKIIVSNMPKGGFDFALISRKVKNILLSGNERNSFLQAQILLTGYKYKLIPYHRTDRLTGTSKWTFSKKLKYLIDGIMAYSYLPIRMMTVSGAIIALCGFVYAGIIIFARLVNNIPFKGWAPIMVLILVLSGIQMLMLGIIGEYLWRTLDQVRNRPQYFIEKIYE